MLDHLIHTLQPIVDFIMQDIQVTYLTVCAIIIVLAVLLILIDMAYVLRHDRRY